MSIRWDDQSPIYRQLRQRVETMILDGLLQPGDALPSVRQVAADYQINPITVSRAYQELVDEQLVEKRRGLGMFVMQGAPEKLLESQRQQFMLHEWPAMCERIARLGLNAEQLLRQLPQQSQVQIQAQSQRRQGATGLPASGSQISGGQP